MIRLVAFLSLCLAPLLAVAALDPALLRDGERLPGVIQTVLPSDIAARARFITTGGD